MATTQHQVQAGDALTTIAAKFGITLAELLQANPNITNPNMIALGQIIAIPGDSSAPPIPSTAGGAHDAT